MVSKDKKNILELLNIKEDDKFEDSNFYLKLINKKSKLTEEEHKSNMDLYRRKTQTFIESYSNFEDSRIFLKGSTTNNPQNDFAQHFVDTNKRCQNYIRDTSLTNRFYAYPKLRELIRLKDDLVDSRRTPAFFLKENLRKYKLVNLENEFDVVYIDPPLEEYKRKHPIIHKNLDIWTWEKIKKLQINEITSTRSFIFLWCGSEDGLEKGRECLKAWGFRRCEDICWIKSNKKNKAISHALKSGILQNQKEHLLMGIKGTVRRNTDVDFIHSNIDLDVIVSDEPPFGSLEKPEEVFNLIEHLCLSRRRLLLFGNENSIRDGWVVIGKDLNFSNYNPTYYRSHIENDGILIGSTPEIEQLRPKSPVLRQNQNRINNYATSQQTVHFDLPFLSTNNSNSKYNP